MGAIANQLSKCHQKYVSINWPSLYEKTCQLNGDSSTHFCISIWRLQFMALLLYCIKLHIHRFFGFRIENSAVVTIWEGLENATLIPYNCTQKFLGLGRVLSVATQNSTHTQTQHFQVLIPNSIPNTQNFLVYNCVNYVKYYSYTQTVAPKIFGYWV